MKDDQRNYVIVGGFVLSMLAGLILWLAILSGRTGATDAYYILYDNVGNLSAGTEILYEGYRVGLIEEIRPVSADGRRRFRVDVTVQKGWEIPDDSLAEIFTSGLLSPAVIQIDAGDSPTFLAPGSQIPSQEASDVFALVGDLAQNSLKPLIDSFGERVPQILAELEIFTGELNATLARVQEVLKPGNTQRLEEILVKLERTTDNAASFSGDLHATQQMLDRVLVRIEELLDSDQGDVGQAVADLQHSLDSVARHIDAINANLESATRDMSEFSRQLREDPSVMLRGRNGGTEPGGTK
jgi:phospholipid/cholesterol/gamma-HCH transport system substrate-binding protein